MEIFLKYFIFAVVVAFALAKLEIQIEGKHGWAENLPTWRVKNRLTKFIFGEQSYTGYHFWLAMTLLSLVQLPFVFFSTWSITLELQVIAILLLIILIEDFLWFVLNPEYGIKKFNKANISWHKNWFLGIPMLYHKMGLMVLGLLLLSTFF